MTGVLTTYDGFNVRLFNHKSIDKITSCICHRLLAFQYYFIIIIIIIIIVNTGIPFYYLTNHQGKLLTQVALVFFFYSIFFPVTCYLLLVASRARTMT